MQRSDNFFAEQTLLMVSNAKLGMMSDSKIIDTLLKTDFAGLPQKPKWVDGSGLSRYNLITPQDFVWVLTQMKNNFSWERLSTIFPRQGHYGLDPLNAAKYPAADLTVERIGELAKYDLATWLCSATPPRTNESATSEPS